MSEDPAPPENSASEVDPTTMHHGFGQIALLGVVVLIAVAAARMFQLAGTMGPPAPPEVVRAGSLVEWASWTHLRAGSARLPKDLPQALADYRKAFPGLSFAPAWPAGWPESRREVLAAAYHPEHAALQLRFRDGEGHGSLFLMPAGEGPKPPAATMDRGGIRVRVLHLDPLLGVVVEAGPRQP